MTTGKFCTRDTIVAQKDASIVEVAKLMRERHVGDIVIVSDEGGENVPVGIVTDRDLVVEIIAQELSPDDVAIGDIMSYELVTAREDDSLWDTIQQMRIKGVRRMPVVNARGGLAGIVTLDDVLELLADELSALGKTVGREQQRERGHRR
jgi:CBS domain-containing protein